LRGLHGKPSLIWSQDDDHEMEGCDMMFLQSVRLVYRYKSKVAGVLVKRH